MYQELQSSLGGGGSLSADIHTFTSQASIPITCEVGDIVVVSAVRSAAGYGFLWNGADWNASTDSIGLVSQGTNNATFYYKPAQANNTFSIESGATLTGGYSIISSS